MQSIFSAVLVLSLIWIAALKLQPPPPAPERVAVFTPAGRLVPMINMMLFDARPAFRNCNSYDFRNVRIKLNEELYACDVVRGGELKEMPFTGRELSEFSIDADSDYGPIHREWKRALCGPAQ